MARRKKSRFNWFWVVLVIVIVIGYIYLLDTEDNPPQPNISFSPTAEILGTSTETIPIFETALSRDDWYELYFTTPKIPFDQIYTGGIENKLIEKIDKAKSSIEVAVFEFNIESVAQALIRAQNRGVDVKVVYDNEHTAGDPQIDELIQVGIDTVPDNRSAYMHNKFFVFDSVCVWTGSFNISMNAAYRNSENAIYFCSDKAAANYSTEFQEMFLGNFGPSSASNTPFPTFYINGVLIENYFGPEDEVMSKVISVVGQAKSSIHFMVFSFTDDELGQEMINQAKNKVVVEGIFESLGADTQYSECGTLLNQGYDIRLDGNPKTFHHKVIIVDGKVVIFGSYNFSANADKSNDENILIVHDTSLAQKFEREYQLMKSQAIVPSGNTCSK